MKKSKQETGITNSLQDAINQIQADVKGAKTSSKIVDVITFCNSPDYLNLPANGFKLYVSQRIILKTFYMGSGGNEGVKLNKEEWEWLYEQAKDEVRDEMVYEKNIKDVIKKILVKEKGEKITPFNELHLAAGRRASKCRWEEDRISTTEGSLTFKELNIRLNNKEKIGICTYDSKTLKRSITYAIKSQDNGEVKCYEIQTKRGIKETSSWNHPYLVWRKEWETPKFIKMSQLKVGDKIAVANCTELFGKGGVGVNRAALLGHLYGDGGITKNVLYTTACPVMLRDFTGIIKAEFPEYLVRHKENKIRPYDYTVIKKSRRKMQNGSMDNEVKEWLKSINCFGDKSIHKKVPECIYKGSKEEIAAFLSRLFGCDGWASTKTNTDRLHKTPGSSIGYSSSSQKLMDGVRHLLLKFGIHSQITHRMAKCNGKEFDAWILVIKRKESIARFEKEINIFSKEDRVRRAVTLANQRVESKSEFGSVPIGVWNYINTVARDRKLSGADIVGKHGVGHNERLRKQYSPGQSKILAYGESISDEFLINMGASDVKWDEVGFISFVGKKKTIDLEVKGTHIIGGDIISHNTSLSSIISAYEAYKVIVINNGDPHSFYNLPADDEIAIINVALSQKQAEKLFNDIYTRLRNSKFFASRIAKATTSEIRLYTDSDIKKKKQLKEQGSMFDIPGSILILCGHSNPDTLAGKSAILILFDELAHYDDTGKVTGTYFYNRLKPSLAKFIPKGDGRLVEISSPNAETGIFHDLFKSAPTNDLILSYQLPTWDMNPEITYESLLPDRKRNPDVFAVEYGAQWAKGGVYGNYFPPDLISRCIRLDLTPHTRPMPGFNYYLHVDPAKNNNRYVALMVAKEYYINNYGKRRSRVRLANIWVWDPQPGVGILYNEVERELVRICATFHPLTVSFDQYNSISTIQMLRNHGVNCVDTSFNRGYKNKIYQNLKEMMGYQPEPEILLYDEPRLILEMKCLKYRPTIRGVSLMVDKYGEINTDDCCDCLSGACAMASENIRPSLPLPVTVRGPW